MVFFEKKKLAVSKYCIIATRREREKTESFRDLPTLNRCIHFSLNKRIGSNGCNVSYQIKGIWNMVSSGDLYQEWEYCSYKTGLGLTLVT